MSVAGLEVGEGPERQALLSTARGLIMVAAPLAGIMVGAPYFIDGFPSNKAIGWGALYAVLLVAGLVLSRKRLGQWLLIAAMAASIPWQLAFPDGMSEYSSIDDIVIFACISAVMLTNKWVGLCFALLGGVVTIWIWEFGPSYVVAVSHFIGEGIESEVQIVSALVLAWWAWDVLRKEANANDRLFEAIVSDTQRVIQVSALARTRREVSTILHESLLNTIRYVFTTPAVNVELLGREIERTDALLVEEPEFEEFSIAALETTVIDDAPTKNLVHFEAPGDEIQLSAEVFRALRAAIGEAVRNAVTHGYATRVDVLVTVDGTRLQVEVSDNGRGVGANGREGFGLRYAITENIASVSGETTINTDFSLSMSVPISVTERSALTLAATGDAFAKARLVVTAALSGLAIGGLFYTADLVVNFVPAEWFAAMVSVPAFLVPVFVVLRRQSLAPWLGLVLSLFAAAVPALLVSDSIECIEALSLVGLMSATSASVVTIVLWTRRGFAAISIPIWMVSAAWMLSSVAPQCQQNTTASALYVVAAAPVLLIFGYFLMRGFNRANAASLKAAQQQREERAQLRAAEVVEAEYSELVSQAQETLRSVVDEGYLSESARLRLEQLEAKIRAAIQVDPDSSSGMALLAHDTVNRFVNRGLRVRARAFVDSGDRRPVSEEVRGAMRAITGGINGGELEVQLITDGDTDILTMRFAGCGPVANLREEVDGCVISTREVNDGFILVVRRPVVHDPLVVKM